MIWFIQQRLTDCFH